MISILLKKILQNSLIKRSKKIGITGGSIRFFKLSNNGELGLCLSVNSKKELSESELESVT